MSTIVLASASGAPGATVTALGLSLVWPRDVVLVDADRDATHAVLAGYLSGRTSRGLGLTGVLQAYRERAPLGEALLRNALELPVPPTRATRRRPAGQAEPEVRRLFVPGFTHLPTVDLFDGAWAGLLDDVRDAPFDVVVDAGRVGHRGLPVDLVAGADLVAMVCRSSLVSLAGLSPHLPGLVEAAGPGRVGVLMVGPGRPYGAREVAQQFGVPVLGEVAWDAAAADDLAHGAAPSTGWDRSRLRSSLDELVGALGAALLTSGPTPAVLGR